MAVCAKNRTMRSTLKRFAKLTAGYSLVTLAGPLATIFLTPLYTKVLSPADYGVVDVTLTLGGFIGIFVVLGMDQALSTCFFNGDEDYRRDLVTTAVVYVAGTGLIAGACLALVAVPAARLLFKDPARSTMIFLLAVSLVSAPIYGVINAGLRLRMSVKRVNALGFGYLAALIVSNVTMVLVLHFKATGIIAANVSANLFACVLGLWLAHDIFRGRFSLQLLRRLIPIGAGLLPGALSSLLFLNVDRLILTQFVPQNDLGLYSIANKLASMLVVLIGPAWNAWWPMALEMANEPDAPRQYARMFEYLSVASMFLAIGIGIFAPEILIIFARAAYLPAAPYTLVLLIFYGPLTFMTFCLTIGLYVRKRTLLLSIASIVAAVVNIALNFLLCPLIGVWGAVWATVAAAVAMFIVIYMSSQHVMPVDYRWLRIAALSAIYLGLVAAFVLSPELNTIGFKIGALLLFVIAVFAVGIVTRSQIQIGLDLIRYRLTSMVQRS